MAFARIIGSFESIAFLKVLHLMCVNVAYSAFQVNFHCRLITHAKITSQWKCFARQQCIFLSKVIK